MIGTSELLEEVKTRLGITGNYQDDLLKGYIQDVKDYLFDSGVDRLVIDDRVSIGVIARGVADLWNYGSGEGKLSETFYQRAIQLRYKTPTETLEELVARLVKESTSDATCSSENMLDGVVGYNTGEKVVGTIKTYDGEIEVDPSGDVKRIATARKYVENDIVIKPVSKDVDPNIQPFNIKKGITILSVEGELDSDDRPDQTKTIIPTTSRQVVTPDTGFELASVNVEAVTKDIDSNITAENIKKDVAILGVTGSFEGEGIVPTGTKEITANGEYDVSLFEKANVNVQLDLQEKTVNPTIQNQVIEPDANYDGLSKVNVGAVNPSDYYKTEEETVINPSINEQEILPTEGHVFSKITVNAVDPSDYQKPEETKTENLSMASGNQVVNATSGKVMTQVTITKPETLQPTNIKKDVNIGGVVGTLESGITPSGKINITSTSQVDVTNYASAQVVDSELVASNVKSGVNILGIIGTFAGGGGLPSEITEIQTGSFTLASDTSLHTVDPDMSGQPQFIVCYDSDYNGIVGGVISFLYSNVGNLRMRSGVRSNASAGTLSASLAAGDFQFDRVNFQCGGGSWYYFKAGHTYKWVCWR